VTDSVQPQWTAPEITDLDAEGETGGGAGTAPEDLKSPCTMEMSAPAPVGGPS